jgi:hypothetical protein
VSKNKSLVSPSRCFLVGGALAVSELPFFASHWIETDELRKKK